MKKEYLSRALLLSSRHSTGQFVILVSESLIYLVIAMCLIDSNGTE